MITHVVTFTWRSGTTQDQVAILARALDAFPPLIPQLSSYQHGSDLRPRQGNADYAVVATLNTPQQVPGYLEHPDHLRIVEEILTPCWPVVRLCRSP